MSAQVLVDCQLATLQPQPGDPLGIVRDAALVWEGEHVRWVGPRRDLPAPWAQAPRHEAAGAWVTPGLIDCHTHLVWGGSRAEEFRMRLHGASYEDIARIGGGIVSTVKATRAASAAQLQAAALKRLDALLAEGVTTVEIKSGYGLDAETEAKCLHVARQLAQARAVSVRTTFLGAHALPPNLPSSPTPTSTPWSACCPNCMRKAWWMRWTCFASASASACCRPNACSPPRRRWACPSSCMPSSSAIARALHWPRATGP